MCAFPDDGPRFEEAVQAGSAIEWWFFQGFYESVTAVRQYFMLTLFRSNLRTEDGEFTQGYQLLLALLGANETGAHTAISWVDPGAMRIAIERLSRGSLGIDPLLQRALLEELTDHGPPCPLILQPYPPTVVSGPLVLHWDTFHLEQRDDGFLVTFADPNTGKPITMEICAGALLKVLIDDSPQQLGRGMHYHSYPRSTLHGVDHLGQQTGGEVWIDHQWGSTDWFYQDRSGVWLGWDWFGIQLDDGSDWVVMRHRDARTGEVISSHTTFREASGRIRAAKGMELTPLRCWESPHTHIRYPVAWKIEIPEFQATLEFEPLVNDQELASFGTMRAVWEGIGTIRGNISAQPVQGRARGEFHGYGYVFDFKECLNQFGKRVDQRLETFLPRKPTHEDVVRFVGAPRWKHEVAAYEDCISTPIWDLIDRSGKRWRPVFGLLLLECLGIPSGPYEEMICTVSELIHDGALIIDDIEDNSRLRRGQECLHLRYGVDVALNAGNSLYPLPGLSVIDHPLLSAEQRGQVLEIKERTFIEAHCGQATDIYWSRNINPKQFGRWLNDDFEDKILQMYAFKTASALKAIAAIASVIAGAHSKLKSSCLEYAELLGVAFQIVDDVHNFSRSPDWTKVPGEDLLNGKPTYVIVTAVRMLDAVRSERLLQILCSPTLRSDESIYAEGRELVEASGSLEHCRSVAQTMTRDAWSGFTTQVRSSDAKILLNALTMNLVDLAHNV